jgi:uncharacterized protein
MARRSTTPQSSETTSLGWSSSGPSPGVAGGWKPGGQFSKIGGAFELNALDHLLGNAVAANHLRRAEWLLAHGANANSLHAYSKRLQREEALIQGHEEMADLLIRHGRQRRRSPERLPSGPRA